MTRSGVQRPIATDTNSPDAGGGASARGANRSRFWPARREPTRGPISNRSRHSVKQMKCRVRRPGNTKQRHVSTRFHDSIDLCGQWGSKDQECGERIAQRCRVWCLVAPSHRRLVLNIAGEAICSTNYAASIVLLRARLPVFRPRCQFSAQKRLINFINWWCVPRFTQHTINNSINTHIYKYKFESESESNIECETLRPEFN